MAPSNDRRCINCGCFAKDATLEPGFDHLFCKRCAPRGQTWVTLVRHATSQPVSPTRGTIDISCSGCDKVIGDRPAMLYAVPLCFDCIEKGLSNPPLKVSSASLLKKSYAAAKETLDGAREVRLLELKAEGRPFDPKAYAQALALIRSEADSPAAADVSEFAFALRCKRGQLPFVPLSLREARCGFTTTLYMQPASDAARCADVLVAAIDGLTEFFKPGVPDADVIQWCAAVALRGFGSLAADERKQVAAVLRKAAGAKAAKAGTMPIKTLRTMTDSPTQLTLEAIASVANHLDPQSAAEDDKFPSPRPSVSKVSAPKPSVSNVSNVSKPKGSVSKVTPPKPSAPKSAKRR